MSNRVIDPERDSIIIQAAKDFPSPSGNVIWKEAFERNPEWKAKLAPTDELTSRLYARTAQMRNKGMFGEAAKANSKDKKVAWNKGIKTGPKNKHGKQQIQIYKNGTHPQVVGATSQVSVNFCPNCAGPVGVLTDAANLINAARQSGITMQQLRVALEAMVKSGAV
jgi:hypothetical protein